MELQQENWFSKKNLEIDVEINEEKKLDDGNFWQISLILNKFTRKMCRKCVFFRGQYFMGKWLIISA